MWSFALSFNGYEELGSFEASAASAQLKKRAALRDIRNELFFAARASRHGGDDRFIDVYLELLPLFRKWANTGKGRVDRS
ncbi:MAG: hypothetical protein B7Z42_14600 [Brevundimonas sp. 12-68-7]|uniref:Uncharacterized protein n=1 Tax=Brevundimonas subvibrioides TaxID=74313 RepID=A0A258FN20_9CAUL|nr:MAG: hypothetical protein B7Z42_14600 [Brevundimonas sp. 12-68-7]OYX33881.1 MAG: hypothetical protein B7Z01_07650 [Brevundimonas subvibrioides]